MQIFEYVLNWLYCKNGSISYIPISFADGSVFPVLKAVGCSAVRA